MITTRSDVTFAVSQLTKFNTNSENIHHKTADQTIQYLYDTKEKTLRYENEDNRACLFIYISDILFANNTLNCKSSQSYIMMLFEDVIV